MENDGTMAKGTRYTDEFKQKVIRFLSESRSLSFVRHEGNRTGRQGLGSGAGDAAALAQRAGCDGHGTDGQSEQKAMAELKRLRAENAELRRANEILTTTSTFPRPVLTRHGVEGHVHRRIPGSFRGRADLQGAVRVVGLRVSDATRLLHVQKQAREPHVSEARGADARHHGDSRGLLHGRVRVQEGPRPTDRPEVDRHRPRPDDEHHVQARHPRHAPQQDAGDHHAREGLGGKLDLVDGKFEACAPNRLHVDDIKYMRMADRRFDYIAFAADVFMQRIVGWVCATTMDTKKLPLQAPEQTIS